MTKEPSLVEVSGFPIPDAALDDRLGFVGTAGSGKTYNSSAAVERILARGGRVVIPDPLGVWWGLGLNADGVKPAPWREQGKLVIFGGEHGDIPLNEQAGKLIGETVAGMAESAIIDLSGFGTKASERRFMLAFLTAFYRHAAGEPVHLVFDEADMWAPQRLLDKEGEAAKLLGMMETVVRRGRIKGFIPWLITQRPAVLSKDVLSQVDGLVAFKLTSSQDRDAIGSWIEGQADRKEGQAILASLPTMQRGQGVVWIPGRGVIETATFPLKRTFDSSRTPTRGEAVQHRDLKPLNLERLKGKLASIEDEARANDPAVLKAEIARLKRELAKAEKAKSTPPPPVIANAEQLAAARAEGERIGISKGIAMAQNALKALARGGVGVSFAKPKLEIAPVRQEPRAEPAGNGRLPLSGSASTPIAGAVTKPQQKILDALAWWAAFGIDEPTSEQVAFIAGYSPGSGGFNNLKGGLRSMGLIDYPAGGRVALTNEGRAIAPAPSIAPNREAFHAAVQQKLSGPQWRVLSPVIDAYPDSISSDQVASDAGYSAGSGGFNNLRGSLRTLGLIDYPSGGQVRANDWLFP